MSLLTKPIRALNVDVTKGKFIIPLTFAWAAVTDTIVSGYPIFPGIGYDCAITAFDLAQVNSNYQLPNVKQIAGTISYGAPSNHVVGNLFIRVLNTQQVLSIGPTIPNDAFQNNIVSFSLPINTVEAQGTSNLEFCKVVDSLGVLFGNAQLSLLTYNEDAYILTM